MACTTLLFVCGGVNFCVAQQFDFLFFEHGGTQNHNLRFLPGGVDVR
jgi:hypothetical protein